MTNNYFEQDYSKEQEIKQVYDKAYREKDEQVMDACRKQMRTLRQAQEAKGKTYIMVYRLYEEMKECGNDRIDLGGSITLWDDKIPETLEALKEFGITEFTYSSTATDAINQAMIFQRLGCKLEGLVTIKKWTQDFHTREYETTAALAFTF